MTFKNWVLGHQFPCIKFKAFLDKSVVLQIFKSENSWLSICKLLLYLTTSPGIRVSSQSVSDEIIAADGRIQFGSHSLTVRVISWGYQEEKKSSVNEKKIGLKVTPERFIWGQGTCFLCCHFLDQQNQYLEKFRHMMQNGPNATYTECPSCFICCLFCFCFCLFVSLSVRKETSIEKNCLHQIACRQTGRAFFFSWLMFDIGPEIGPGLHKKGSWTITE